MLPTIFCPLIIYDLGHRNDLEAYNLASLSIITVGDFP